MLEFEGWRIKRDPLNFILQKLVPPGKKSKSGLPTWKTVAYHNRLKEGFGRCLERLADEHVFVHGDAKAIFRAQENIYQMIQEGLKNVSDDFIEKIDS